MRDILFKAKRISDGQWVEGYLYKQVGVKDRIYFAIEVIDNTVKAYEVDESTICQYTGLTDKNGNKIWENDVVWVCETDRAIVIFSEKYSGYILQPIGDYYFDSPMLADNVDIIDNIIGNIFDNPELVKEGTE